MVFNSFEFAVFFILVTVGFWSVASSRTARMSLLLVASYYFYMSWNWKFAGLIFGSTILDYLVGAQIFKASDKKAKKRWLLVSMAGNLGCLGVFKYFNFFADSVNAFFSRLGLEMAMANWELILPVGISFYTFQTMSYTIDIYRGELKPTKSFLDFAVFVAFFPQLVAGPIVRASEFLPQLKQEPRFSDRKALDGISQILFGLFKKICIGDALAAALVDPAFNNPEHFSGVTLLFAVYGYAMQIYCDFSGYSDVAIGAAKVLGFNLPLNFNRPYLAASITEFWRRWHLSLSTWLRDYLYIPLGGNRKGSRRTYINLMVTMLLGGLWHGAAWNFVIWGGLHGVFLGMERFVPKKVDIPSIINKRLFRQLLTFHLVCLTWILFRANSAENGFLILKRITSLADGVSGLSPHFLIPLLVGFTLHFLPSRLKSELSDKFTVLPSWAQAIVVGGGIFIFMIIGVDDVPFIYFQF